MATRQGFNHLPEVMRAMQPAIIKLVEKATVDVAAGAAAAAPIDTGALAESYTADVNGLTGTAGSNMEYAPYVEFGTVHSGAQAHLVPAAMKVKDALRPLSDEFGRAIEKAAR